MLLYLAVLAIFVIVLLTISSRVRKAARLAFESETIETDEFTLLKPEGFISPVNDKSKFAFEAYSKDFGAGDAGNLRQAQVSVSVFEDKNFDKSRAQTSGETIENDTAYNFCKIIEDEKRAKIYELKISVLKDSLADYQSRVDETLQSFRLK